MPDIVSRIRVEAHGADQAAREIRKLRDAYTEVGQAAQNLSPGGMGADPFAQAVSAPGGGVYGGQRSPADIMDRETRGRNYRDQVRERETSNSAFGGRGVPGGVGQGIGTAEAVATGRAGAAIGTAATGIGALLGGPLGIGLLAGGAVVMGAQKFADNAFERMQNIWGTGISQRLGRTYENIQDVQTGYGRTGIPFGMVQQFFQAASQTGFNMNRPGALGATNMMMEAMASLGVDPSTVGGLMGGISRAGLDMGRLGGDRGYGLIGQVTKSFGRENVGLYLQEMTRGINEMATKGIDIQEEALTRQTNLLGAFRQYGGMTPEGAIAMNRQMMARGITAAQLQRPEDIIAFQAFRSTGVSVTDAMLAMEQNPDEVNRRVYEHLKGATGGREDILRLRLQEYMGGGTTISQVVDFINTMEGMGKKSQEELSSDLGAGSGWIGRHYDENGNLVYDDPARETVAVRQAELLRGVEESMLALTTGITKTLRDLLTGGLEVNALRITWKGYEPTFTSQMEDRIPKDQPGRETLISIRGDQRITSSLVGMLTAAGVSTPYAAIEESTTFGWKGGANEMMNMVARGMLEDTIQARRMGAEDVSGATNMRELTGIMQTFLEREVANKEDFERVLREFIEEAGKRGYVLTDD